MQFYRKEHYMQEFCLLIIIICWYICYRPWRLFLSLTCCTGNCRSLIVIYKISCAGQSQKWRVIEKSDWEESILKRVGVLAAVKELGTRSALVFSWWYQNQESPCGKLSACTNNLVFSFFGEPPGSLKYHCYEYEFWFLSWYEQNGNFIPKYCQLLDTFKNW